MKHVTLYWTRARVLADLRCQGVAKPEAEHVRLAHASIAQIDGGIQNQIVKALYAIVTVYLENHQGQLREFRLLDLDPADVAHRLYQLLPKILIDYKPDHSSSAKLPSFVCGYIYNLLRDLRCRQRREWTNVEPAMLEICQPLSASYSEMRAIDIGGDQQMVQLAAELMQWLQEQVFNAKHLLACELRWLKGQSVKEIAKQVEMSACAIQKAIGRKKDELPRRLLLYVDYLEKRSPA